MTLFSSSMTNMRLGVIHFSTCGTLFVPASGPRRLPRGYGAVNAYALFSKENFRQGEKIGDASKRTAQLWRGLSEVDKKKFETEAEKLTKQRRESFEKLSIKEQNNLKHQNVERLSKKDLRYYHKQVNQLGKPKQPPNAYALYLKEVMKNVKSLEESQKEMTKGATVWQSMNAKEKTLDCEKAKLELAMDILHGKKIDPYKEALKNAAQNWKNNNDIKSPYLSEAKSLRDAYLAEMDKWVTNLKKTGTEVPVRPINRSKSVSPIRSAATSTRKLSKTRSKSVRSTSNTGSKPRGPKKNASKKY